jgi:hypothetical protein
MACLSIAVTIGSIIFNLVNMAFLKIKQKWFAKKDKAVKAPGEIPQREQDYVVQEQID